MQRAASALSFLVLFAAFVALDEGLLGANPGELEDLGDSSQEVIDEDRRAVFGIFDGIESALAREANCPACGNYLDAREYQITKLVVILIPTLLPQLKAEVERRYSEVLVEWARLKLSITEFRAIKKRDDLDRLKRFKVDQHFLPTPRLIGSHQQQSNPFPICPTDDGNDLTFQGRRASMELPPAVLDREAPSRALELSANTRPHAPAPLLRHQITGIRPRDHRVDHLSVVQRRLLQVLQVAAVDLLPGEVASLGNVVSRAQSQSGREGQSIGPLEWTALAERCNALFASDDPPDGIVVTHGSYVLEETAYFLNLTVHSERPVVLTGAQRPSTAISSDAGINLVNAVLAASAPASRGKGVLAVLNHQINAARDVTKTSTYRTEAFESRDLGFLGYVDSDRSVVYYRSPTKRHTAASEFYVSAATHFPWVDIIYGYAGDDGRAVDALVERGARGLILTGGIGNIATRAAVARAIGKGVAVVRSNHMGSGRVIATPASVRSGIVAADNLSPKKARILLMLALGSTADFEQLQRIFSEY